MAKKPKVAIFDGNQWTGKKAIHRRLSTWHFSPACVKANPDQDWNLQIQDIKNQIRKGSIDALVLHSHNMDYALEVTRGIKNDDIIKDTQVIIVPGRDQYVGKYVTELVESNANYVFNRSPVFNTLEKKLKDLLIHTTPASKKYNIGIIGSGVTGTEIAAGLNGHPGVKSISVAAHTEESLKSFQTTNADLLHDNPINASHDYEILSDADIIFITVANSSYDDRNVAKRESLLKRNLKNWIEMEERLKELSSLDALLVTVTNPTDIAQTLIRGELQYPQEKVLGFSGLDQNRVKAIIAGMYNTQEGIDPIRPRDVIANTMGSHGGKFMCFPWSTYFINTEKEEVNFNEIAFNKLQPSEMTINGAPIDYDQFPENDALRMLDIATDYENWGEEQQIDEIKRYIALMVTWEGRRIIQETGNNPKGVQLGTRRFIDQLRNQERTIQGVYFGQDNPINFGINTLEAMTNAYVEISTNKKGLYINKQTLIGADEISPKEIAYMKKSLRGNQEMAKQVMKAYAEMKD